MDMERMQRLISKAGLQGVEPVDVDGIAVVHLDNPDQGERARRETEVRTGSYIEDDCPACQELLTNPPEMIVMDADSMLCLGRSGISATSRPVAVS
ncbi:MAG: hypothetical protein V3W44_05095 [Dehalococcoidales bacterium]